MIHYQNMHLARAQENGQTRRLRNPGIAACDRCGCAFEVPACTNGDFSDIISHFCPECIKEGLEELKKKDSSMRSAHHR